MCKKITFLRRTDSGKKPVLSSDLGTKLWVSAFLSFFRAFIMSENDFLGLFWRENWRENDEEDEERWWFGKLKRRGFDANMVVVFGGLEGKR